MRRLLLLLLASVALALHHGVPMAEATSGMDGDHGSAPMSLGMTLLCAGVIVAAFELVRRAAVRAFGPRDPHRSKTTAASDARCEYSARGRPPPRPPALAFLCVNQR